MQSDHLDLIGRPHSVFGRDLAGCTSTIDQKIREGSFLVLGGAGSIGSAVVRRLFSSQPRRLHLVDSSENNLVEVVRDLRSSVGYIDGEFRTLALDAGRREFESYLKSLSQPFDYVLNLAAMKHVRSERDAFTFMRMVRTNVLMTRRTLELAAELGTRRYFAVSSDKAANPANAMGATKRAMELCLIEGASRCEVCSARFANVAFSDGSLLHGFDQRLAKLQPLSAPEDVQRYFLTADEAATLCLMSCLVGKSLECFYPAPGSDFKPTSFRAIAERYLESRGYEPYPCETEEEARRRVTELSAKDRWPCYFFRSDTTGEKELEEFHSAGEIVDRSRFEEIGIVRWPADGSEGLKDFVRSIEDMLGSGRWARADILDALQALVPQFQHQETGKFLDNRM